METGLCNRCIGQICNYGQYNMGDKPLFFRGQNCSDAYLIIYLVPALFFK